MQLLAMYSRNKKFEKEVGVRKKVLSNLAKKLLATHSTGNIGYYLCLFMQTQFQLGSYIHVCANETHSIANLRDLMPTLAGIIISNTNQPKYGLNLVYLVENVCYLCIHGCT